MSYNVQYIVNTTYQNNQTIVSVNCNDIPWKDNSMYNAFWNCSNLQTVTNINNNITNMYSTFSGCRKLVNAPEIPNSVTNIGFTFENCTNLANAPVIPNSVTDMFATFAHCYKLVNAPAIPNSVTNMQQTFTYCNKMVNAPVIPNSVTNMERTFATCRNLVTAPNIPESVTTMGSGITGTFSGCTNLTGNIYIHSNQISVGYAGSAPNIFANTTKIKNVYIPYKYANGVYTETYNTFTSSGYDENGTLQGVYLKDINPPMKYIETEGYEFTNANDKVSLTKYTGTSTTVTVPTIQEE